MLVSTPHTYLMHCPQSMHWKYKHEIGKKKDQLGLDWDFNDQRLAATGRKNWTCSTFATSRRRLGRSCQPSFTIEEIASKLRRDARRYVA